MPQFNVEQRDDVRIVRFTKAHLSDDWTARQIGGDLLDLAGQKDAGRLLLNCEGVSFMSSTMIGQLVLLSKKCRADRRELRLCRIAPSIMEVLKLLCLDTLLSIHAEEAAALASFGSPHPVPAPPNEAFLAERQRRAEAGDASAQYELGKCHEEGQGVAQDFAAALKWYRAAAEQGQVDAQYALGTWHAYGMHGPQDYAEAAKWYQKAGEQGHAESQNLMGLSFRYGLAGREDLTAAAGWYRQAAAQGHLKARQALSELEAR